MGAYYLDIPSAEEKDWDYARNKQVLLMSPVGEWSSSVFSSSLELNGTRYFGPNRDYSHQGLLLRLGAEVYKTLDGILFASAGSEGMGVRVEPQRVLYRYSDLEAGFTLSGGGLRVELDRPDVELLPLLDMREMNQGSGLEPYCWQVQGDWLSASNGKITIRIGPIKETERADFTSEWVYKHGSGFRYRDEKDYIRFVRETRRVYAPAKLKVSGTVLNVEAEGAAAQPKLETAAPEPSYDWLKKVVVREGALSTPMLLRLQTLRNFGLNLDGGWFPEAGCWWFSRPWVRDALEGIIHNFQVYRLFGWTERVRSVALLLLENLEDRLGLPTILGGSQPCADAPPLLLYLCSMIRDQRLTAKAINVTTRLLEEMIRRSRYEMGMVKGDSAEPVLREGLVACAPFQSWTDTRLGPDKRPSRLPKEWPETDEEWTQPRYYLPEVNGYWVRALKNLCTVADSLGVAIPNALADALGLMEHSFRKVLWDKNGGHIFNIVDADNRRSDSSKTSMGIVGMACTLHIFSSDEIRAAYNSSRRLLVNRRLRVLGENSLPFGMLVTGSGSPFLGDEEYHRSVIWPRDTPYVIKLMEALGMEHDILGILLNTLDQTISEGALMYTSEIFGLPTGRNPNPSDTGMSIIPLKNPAQYWSHWCDPFIDRVFRILD